MASKMLRKRQFGGGEPTTTRGDQNFNEVEQTGAESPDPLPSPTRETFFDSFSPTPTSRLPPATTTSPSTGNNGLMPGPSTSNTKNSSGISSGPLAGVVIGVVVGTAILTFLITYFFIFRKRRSSHREDPNLDHLNKQLESESSGGAVGPSPEPVAARHSMSPSRKSVPVVITDINSVLSKVVDITGEPSLHAVDNGAIRTQISAVFERIAQHVDNYYSADPSSLAGQGADIGQISAYDSPELPSSVAALLSEPANYRAVIIHCLTRTILYSILPGSGRLSPAGGDFLSPLYSAYPHIMESDPDPGNIPRLLYYILIRDGSKVTNMASPETERLLQVWRLFNSHIFHMSTHRDPEFALSDINAAIHRAADDFTEAFEAYANRQQSETERGGSLVKTMQFAAEIGDWLFSQPFRVRFNWHADTVAHPQGIAAQPAMVKVTDEEGARLSSPVKILDAVTMGIIAV
ncbi:hypothetical protein FQN57_001859 [Myotisia sp. PD_48]|nr:hypothetical protein FQN57_001859 [Myotisia sp. PD_48]